MRTTRCAGQTLVLCDACGAPVVGYARDYGDKTGIYRCRGSHCARVQALVTQKKQTGKFPTRRVKLSR
jgi:hypothetical protein